MFRLLKLSNNLHSLSHCRRSMNTVTVIGCGLMGAGIAQVAAQSGYSVTLVDVDRALLDRSIENVRKSLQRVAAKKWADSPAEQQRFVTAGIDAISTSTDAIAAAKQSHLIIEAIVEDIAVKQKLFRSLDEVAPASCIFASNTSSLSISEMAAVTKRPDKFGGLHFFNPVPMMALVEVVAAARTSTATAEALFTFAKSLGKVAVRCRDTPGFIVNRLLVPYLGESFRMLERGDATAEDIDQAMRLGAGYPMGPFVLADYVGLDTSKAILDGWREKFPDNPLFAPIPMLDKLVREGNVGRKSGRGVYVYEGKGAS